MPKLKVTTKVPCQYLEAWNDKQSRDSHDGKGKQLLSSLVGRSRKLDEWFASVCPKVTYTSAGAIRKMKNLCLQRSWWEVSYSLGRTDKEEKWHSGVIEVHWAVTYHFSSFLLRSLINKLEIPEACEQVELHVVAKARNWSQEIQIWALLHHVLGCFLEQDS